MRLITEHKEERIETTLGEIISAINESIAEEYGPIEEDTAHITKLVLERLMSRYETIA